MQRIVAEHIDSKTATDCFKKHRNLIEQIREHLWTLHAQNWIVYFTWVKDQAGIETNELTNHQAEIKNNEYVYYNKSPVSHI